MSSETEKGQEAGKINISVVIPVSLKARLEETARRTNRSLSNLVVTLLSRVDLEALDA